MSRTTLGILALAVLFGVGTAMVQEPQRPGPAKESARPGGNAGKPGEDADTALLRRGGIGTDGESLVKFLSERAGKQPDAKAIDALVRGLGSESFNEREAASKQLVAVGPPALDALRKAAKDGDAETVRRAKQCIEEIEKDNRWDYRRWQLAQAAIRAVVATRPKGAADALLRFLPEAAEELTAELVWYALDKIGRGDGSADPAWEAALSDTSPARRAAAAFVLARHGDGQRRAAACKRLDDPDAGVRLRAAQGLLAAKDTRGVPALIKLLGDKDLALTWQAEELLRWTADEDSPEETVGAGAPEAREKCRKAWEAWWEGRGNRLDLAKRDENWRRPGLVLLCDPEGQAWERGCVWLSGCDGKPRCEWTGLRRPVEARLIPGPRILVAESPTFYRDDPSVDPRNAKFQGRVTERDPAGKVLWEYTGVRDPADFRRLSNGHTLIAGESLTGGEVTRDGKRVSELHEFAKDNGDVLPNRPRFAEDGRVLCAPELKPFGVGYVYEFREGVGLAGGARFDGYFTPLPSFSIESVGADGFLVSGVKSGEVTELARTGKEDCRTIWRSTVSGSTHAAHLLGGQTVVAAKGRVITLDRAGKMIGEVFCERTPFRVRPCLGLVRVGFDWPPPVDGDVGVLVQYRLKGLKSRKPLVRQRMSELLAELGPDGAEAIPALAEACKDADEGARGAAKVAFQKVGGEELPRLLAQIKDQSAPIDARCKSLWRLGDYGSVAKQVAPALIAALKDENAKVRGGAANSLVNMGSEGRIVVPALIAAADDRDPKVRFYAVHSLGGLRPIDKRAVPVLIRKLKDDDDTVRHFAALSLGHIGPVDKQVVPALIEALKEEQTRCGAASALREIGPEARSALPEMLKALDAPITLGPPHLRDTIRQDIIRFCGRLGPDGAEAVPALIKILDSADDAGERNKKTIQAMGLKQDAIRALGAIGPAAQRAVPSLEKLRGNANYAELASEALSKIQPKR
jgi:HEAT repeat protein